MQSKRRDSHWKWLHRGTYDYILTCVLFFHSVPVQGGQAIPLYLEAILVMLSSLSTALQQEKEFINVIWWVHKYLKLTNGQSFPTLFSKIFPSKFRSQDHGHIHRNLASSKDDWQLQGEMGFIPYPLKVRSTNSLEWRTTSYTDSIFSLIAIHPTWLKSQTLFLHVSGNSYAPPWFSCWGVLLPTWTSDQKLWLLSRRKSTEEGVERGTLPSRRRL